MLKRALFGFLAVWCLSSTCGDQELPPLADALWRGELVLIVKGTLHSQGMANQMGGQYDNIPMGFVKEKGEMMLEYQLNINFLINSLGEFTMLAKQVYNGSQSEVNEYYQQFTEETAVDKARVKFPQQVQASEKQNTKLVFRGEESFAQAEFNFGHLQIKPSGRMNKKGELHISGDFVIPLTGEGEGTQVEERQPPSDEYARRTTTFTIKRTFNLPLKFEAAISHRKAPVEGRVSLSCPVENPFAQEGRSIEGKRDFFKPDLSSSGTIRLTPLFK